MAGRWHRPRRLLLMALLSVSLLALLFIDVLEQWLMSVSIMRAETPRTPPPQGVPPLRPEEFLLMPSAHVCQRALPFLLVLVASAPANRHARMAIRNSWGGELLVQKRRVLTLFVTGRSDQDKQLMEEWKEHGDVIQGRFTDSYANLTLKTLSMMTWACSFCPQARFLAKVDDDVMFNPAALLTDLAATDGLSDLYLGRVHHKVAPDHHPSSKHYVVYSGSVYPDYCSGSSYVLSRATLLKLRLAATGMPLTPPLLPEDVFVGICARAMGITPTHSTLFSGGPAVPYSRCCYQAMVSVHHTAPDHMLRYWAELHSATSCSWLRVRVATAICRIRTLTG